LEFLEHEFWFDTVVVCDDDTLRFDVSHNIGDAIDLFENPCHRICTASTCHSNIELCFGHLSSFYYYFYYNCFVILSYE